jgi:hypothetical protein
VVVYDQNVEVAWHERLSPRAPSAWSCHYLEVLVRNPGAFPGSTARELARSAGKFTPVHDAWWAQAQKVHGERDGTRDLIQVVLLGRRLPHEHIVVGLPQPCAPG